MPSAVSGWFRLLLVPAIVQSVLCLPAAKIANAAEVPAGQRVSFSTDIRPLLSDRCFHCHGPDEQTREADLRLDSPGVPEHDGLLTAGKPDESKLFERITSNDPDLKMPPPDSGRELSADEIALIRRWIEQGAEWTTHWAYAPPVRHEAPSVGTDQQQLVANWVDAFVVNRLRETELAPSPEADRITLLRRVTFDLTGLPPTPEEVDAFVNDTSDDAWEKVVDRLLKSEACGERLAVYWLDLVRFADTVGYHGDQDHSISPYRDWVIDAFIDNMPFDQFTREQLAGDLLPDSTTDQKIATGYNRLLQTSHEGGVQVKEYLAMYAADRVRNVSAVWMGATVGCSQCHDHKFDPYTTRDFYSLAAFFADVDEAEHLSRGDNALPTKRAPELVVLTRRERERVAALVRQIEELQARISSLKDDEQETRAKLQSEVAAAEAEKAAIEKNQRRTMVTRAIAPREMRILPRGNWLDDTGAIVLPAIPEFQGSLAADGEQRATRLDLANWLTDAKHGNGLLTARVMANRFWYLLFGQGLSRSLDDFGGQGEPPSHPLLLDRLAWEFVDSGWDVKHMLKLIVMSRTYRQSSQPDDAAVKTDPNNRYFSRQTRFRLPAEMVRDNALAISGLLVRTVGGASVKPYQPDGYYRHLNFPTRTYQQHNDDRQWRRGLYVHWQRQFLHPMFKAFDAPRREECTAQRPRSNTPLASLVLLNDPTFVEAARMFAERTLHDGGSSDTERLDFAFRLAVSRTPDDFERDTFLRALSAFRASAKDAGAESVAQLVKIGLTPGDAKLPAEDVAAWTQIARVLLNLGETNSRY